MTKAPVTVTAISERFTSSSIPGHNCDYVYPLQDNRFNGVGGRCRCGAERVVTMLARVG